MSRLDDLSDSGPVAYGLSSTVWTLPMIARVIAEAFAVSYHAGHVRQVLQALGFSVQRPRRQRAKADPAAQDRWQRYTSPRLKKRPRSVTLPCASPMTPVSAKPRASTKRGRAADSNR